MSESKVSGRKGDGSPPLKQAGSTNRPSGARPAGAKDVVPPSAPQPSKIATEAVKPAVPKPAPVAASHSFKTAIEVAAPPAPTLAEKIESAVAPIAAPDAAAPLPSIVAAPPVEVAPAAEAVPAAEIVETVQAVSEPDAVPAATMEPAAIVSATHEDVIVPQPYPVATMPFAPALTRGMFNMATTFDATTTPAAAAEKVKALFGGLNDRAKTAMEKSTKLGEELGELTKGNVEAIVASSKVAAKGAESMAQGAAEYGKKNFESATAMFKSLAAAKSPTELFQLQSDYAKSSFDSVVAEASKLSEAWVKLAGEMVQPISNRYAVAAEKIKAAAL